MDHSQRGTEKSVVLISGGLDSATLLADAIENSHEVIGVHFNYGQPTEAIELEKAKKLAEHYKIELVEKDIQNIIAQGGLTDGDKDFTNPVEGTGVSSGYVPFRNLLLLTLGASVGASKWRTPGIIIHIYIGAQATDEEGYADCRPKFIAAATQALNFSSDTQHIQVNVPLISLNKIEVLKRAIKLEVPLEYTYSCYRPSNGKPCGKCGACEERIEAFNTLGISDPAYESKTNG